MDSVKEGMVLPEAGIVKPEEMYVLVFFNAECRTTSLHRHDLIRNEKGLFIAYGCRHKLNMPPEKTTISPVEIMLKNKKG